MTATKLSQDQQIPQAAHAGRLQTAPGDDASPCISASPSEPAKCAQIIKSHSRSKVLNLWFYHQTLKPFACPLGGRGHSPGAGLAQHSATTSFKLVSMSISSPPWSTLCSSLWESLFQIDTFGFYR